MALATLLISSKNYSSWSLRGFLLAKLSGIAFREEKISPDDRHIKDELLLRASSILVPCLIDDGVSVWDTLAIAEYLNEKFPDAEMLPRNNVARARCRSISGEMHSGFSALRSSLPMNLRFHKSGFTIWSSAQVDIDRITTIWQECLTQWKGPFLFGPSPTIADCMYAPVVTRFKSYDVGLNLICQDYCKTILAWEPMREWIEDAQSEPDGIVELDFEF